MKSPCPKCIACGPDATITDDLDAIGYEAFCGGAEVDEESGRTEGAKGERISVQVSYKIHIAKRSMSAQS
jgi:adenylyltransferase/sulfurtransferase